MLRLDPNRLPEGSQNDKPAFHGFEILTKGYAETAAQRDEIISFFGRMLHWNDLRKALCFEPRHGVRVSLENRTLDFVICFACNRVKIFEGEKLLSEFALARSKNNPIDQILHQLKKK